MFVNRFESKTIMVTGANGFIGTRLVNELSRLGAQVVAVVRNSESDCSDIADLPGVRIVSCELADVELLPQLVGDIPIDTCVHLAWQGASGDNRADADVQIDNISYSVHLVRVAYRMGVSRFVGIGSLMEIDAAACLPEDGGVPALTAAYPVAKTAARFMTKIECTRWAVEHIWCQVSNVYGLGVREGFVRYAISAMMSDDPAEFTEGKQLYDFTHIDDTIDAIAAVIQEGKAGSCYYLGSSRPRPLRDYIAVIRNAIKPKKEPILGALPYQGAFLSEQAFSCEKLYLDTGFRAKRLFEDEIGAIVDSMDRSKA